MNHPAFRSTNNAQGLLQGISGRSCFLRHFQLLEVELVRLNCKQNYTAEDLFQSEVNLHSSKLQVDLDS